MADYKELAKKIFAGLKPEDIVEQIYAEDYVHQIWRALRLRQQEAALFNTSMVTGLTEILANFWTSDRSQAEDLARVCVLGNASAVKIVNDVQAKNGLRHDAVMGQVLAKRIAEFECIDHMMRNNEASRAAILREIERHRATLRQNKSLEAEHVQDAEFQEVENVP